MKHAACLFVVAVMVASAGAGLDAESQNASSRSAPGTQVEIEIGMLGLSSRQGSEGWFQREIRAFQIANPDIKVSTIALASPRRLERSLITLPTFARNIIGVDSWQGYEAAWLASRGHIVPIDQFLPDPELDPNVFPQNLFGPVTFDGKIWGIPWSTEHTVLVCNWPVFEKAGLTRPPETWEEFFDYARTLTIDTTGDGAIDQHGIFLSKKGVVGFITLSMMMQEKTAMFAGASIDGGALYEGMRRIKQWLDAGVYTARLGRDDTWAMTFASPSHIHEFDKNCRIAPLPTSGRRVVCNNGTHYLVIRKSTPEQEEASWRFVKWISRPDVSLPDQLDGYPCRSDFIEREDFQRLQQRYCENLEVLFTQNALIEDPGPSNLVGRSIALEHILQRIYSTLIGGGDVRPVVVQASEEAAELIEEIPDPAAVVVDLYR